MKKIIQTQQSIILGNMIFRKTMLIGTDVDTRKNKPSLKISHMRVSIPKEVRDRIDIKKGDYVEWEVDTVKKKLTGKLLKAE